MGVTNSNKIVNADRISCDGSLRVTLALTGGTQISFLTRRISYWFWIDPAA